MKTWKPTPQFPRKDNPMPTFGTPGGWSRIPWLIYLFNYKWASSRVLYAEDAMLSKTRHSPFSHTIYIAVGNSQIILLMSV